MTNISLTGITSYSHGCDELIIIKSQWHKQFHLEAKLEINLPFVVIEFYKMQATIQETNTHPEVDWMEGRDDVVQMDLYSVPTAKLWFSSLTVTSDICIWSSI